MISCGANRMKVKNPLKEDKIIAYIEKQIYDETGDTVTAAIISKEEVMFPTVVLLDGSPIAYKKINNCYKYQVEIVNKDNPDFIATGTYTDGYIVYDNKYRGGKLVSDAYFRHNYKEQNGLFLIRSEMIAALEKRFDNYYIYTDVSNDEGYDIFIQSTNYDDINELLSDFESIVTKYRDEVYTCYSVYIYKDETVFNNTNFELYKSCTSNHGGQSYGKDMITQYTGKEVTRIGFSEGFDYNLFTSNGACNAETYNDYVDYNSFDYLVFWYDAEPNSFVGYNSPSTQLFGVK